MTTILCVRKGHEVVMAGDGQATLGESVIFKSKSVKVRRIGNGSIIAGFAGAAADGITLIERLEKEVAELEERMATPEGASDMKLYEQHQQLKKQISDAEEEWENVSLKLEELKS